MDSGIKQAAEKQKLVSGDEEAIEYYDIRHIELSDWNSSIAYPRDTGIAEGKREIARKMMGAGKPAAEIGEFTGLSAEEIERLSRE